MKNKLKILFFTIVISIGLTGCKNNPTEEPKQDIKKQHIEDEDEIRANKLIKYKDSYVGDNSAVGNIVSNLSASVFSKEFSLKTNEKPYEILINYGPNKDLGIKEYNRFWNSRDPNEILEKNAIVLFSLIQNVDIISFNVDSIGEETYKYNKKYVPDLPANVESFKEFFNNKEVF